MEPHYQACLDGLFRQTNLRSEQEAIYQQFRYPFSNASGYNTWMRMGGSGPAPQEWCRFYAYKKVSTPYGGGFSLN